MGLWVKSGSGFRHVINECTDRLFQSVAHAHCYKNRVFLRIVPAIFILTLTSSPVWSFQTYALSDSMLSQESPMALHTVPSPASAGNTDACSPLRQAIRYGRKTPYASSRTSASHELDRRNVGNKTAPGMMVGVLLGVKFALGPKERSTKARKRAIKLDLWTMGGDVRGNRNVLAVSAYRTCQKEQALKALNGFRWQR